MLDKLGIKPDDAEGDVKGDAKDDESDDEYGVERVDQKKK
jgi:hypothetical protein